MEVTFVFDIDGYPDQTQRVVLDNKTYDFRFVYNSYGESWKLFISLPGADPICSFKLTSNTQHLKSYQYNLEIPQGDLIAGGVVDFSARLTQNNIGVGKGAYMWYIS
jgi:hypothetical protein